MLFFESAIIRENIVFQHAGQLLAGGTFTSSNNSAAYTIYWPHNGTNAYQYWQFSNPWVIRDGETKKFYSPSYSTSTGVTTFKQLDLFANMSFSANSYSNSIGDIGGPANWYGGGSVSNLIPSIAYNHTGYQFDLVNNQTKYAGNSMYLYKHQGMVHPFATVSTGIRIIDYDSDGYNFYDDAFPSINTQNSDSDGDGFGDNALGYQGDSCPNVSPILQLITLVVLMPMEMAIPT